MTSRVFNYSHFSVKMWKKLFEKQHCIRFEDFLENESLIKKNNTFCTVFNLFIWNKSCQCRKTK